MNDAAEMAQRAKTTGEHGRLAGQRLCEAAGMWKYLAEVEVNKVARSTLGSSLNTKRPLELAHDTLAHAMVATCMGQANELGARNAITRQLKPSVVAKLYSYAAEQFKEAGVRIQQLLYVRPLAGRIWSAAQRGSLTWAAPACGGAPCRTGASCRTCRARTSSTLRGTYSR